MVIEHMYQRFTLECFPTLQVGLLDFLLLVHLSVLFVLHYDEHHQHHQLSIMVIEYMYQRFFRKDFSYLSGWGC